MAENNLLTSGGAKTDFYNIPTVQPQYTNPLANIMQATQAVHETLGLQQQQQQIGMQRLNYMHDQFGSLVGKKDLGYGDFANVARNLIGAGFPPDQVSAELKKVEGMTPTQMRVFADTHQQNLAGHMERMAGGYKAPHMLNTGNAIIPGGVDPRGGAFSPSGAGVAMGTSPAERNAPATVTDESGNTIQTTIGQRSTAVGMHPVYGVPLEGAITRKGGAATRTVTAPGGTKVKVDESGRALNPDGTPTQAVPGIPGPPPGYKEGLDALVKDRLSANEIAQGLQPLLKALPLAERATAGTGPGTKLENDIRTFLIAQNAIKPDDKVDARHELDKYLNQTVAKSPLSNRSDVGTTLAQASNPNTYTMTQPATIALIKNAITQERMKGAAPLAFEDNPSKYPLHKGGFIQGQDQRAYQLDHMPDGGVALIKEMAALPLKDARRIKFFESLKAAKTVGVGAPGQ
jgi:hypothetical protein